MKGVNVVVHEMDLEKGGNQYQQELFLQTGQRTVPNVFVNGKHVGGNDDTHRAFQNGSLQDLLFMESLPSI